MHPRRLVQFGFAAVGTAVIFSTVMSDGRRASAQGTPASWLTRSFDNNRSSANLTETSLTQSNVNTSSFGFQFETIVDDQVYAQPLYDYQVQGTPAGTVNALYVATTNNTVYALNADTGAIVWSHNFNPNTLPPNGGQVNDGVGCEDAENLNNTGVNSDLGIVGTPVIDPSTTPHTLYVVTQTMEGCTTNCGPSNMTFKLRAMNGATGAVIVSSPPIGQGVTGFDASQQKQTPGLALLSIEGPTIWVAFSSYCDGGSHYHGYMFAYNGQPSLSLIGSFNDTPSGSDYQGGIWQSGQAPAVSTSLGQVFFAAGNGNNNSGDFSDEVMELGPQATNSVLHPPNGAYAPTYVPGACTGTCTIAQNLAYLSAHDLDLGVSGPTATAYGGGLNLIQGSKQGILYNLKVSSTDQFTDIQTPFVVFNGTGDNQIRNVVTAASGVANAPAVYVAIHNQSIYAFQQNSSTGVITTTPFAVSPTTTQNGIPAISSGGNLSLSANSQASSGTGILWLTTPESSNHQGLAPNTGPRILYALNADTLQHLWASSQAWTDYLGKGVYWTPPTVANGRVYVASYGPQDLIPKAPSLFMVAAYGLKSPTFVVPEGALKPFGPLPGPPGPPIAAQSIGSDGTVYVRNRVNGTWNSPSAIAANFTSGAGLAIAQLTSSETDTFVVGNNGALYTIANKSNGWQSPVARTPASLAPAGAPIAAVSAGGRVSAYVIDTSGALESVWWDSTHGWQGPSALTPTNYAPTGAQLAVGIRSSGEGDVYVVGNDGTLKYMAYSGSWTGPYPLPGGSNYAPPGAALATAPDIYGALNVFTIANDGALYTVWDNYGTWTGPVRLSSTGLAPPGRRISAINANNVALEAYVVDNTGTVNWLYISTGTWTSPATIGTTGLAVPGAEISTAIENSNQVDLFVTSATATSSGVLESTNSGSGWSTFAALP